MSTAATLSLSSTTIASSTVTTALSRGQHHPNFQPSDSTDLTFRSCDGILFCLHRKNLETHADSLPGPEISVRPDEEIDLTEPSEILAIVFNLVYPRKQTNIEGMAFKDVIQIAEAVEKYQIFSAMKACEFRLRQFIPTHPAEILSHGIMHDYPLLINEALPRLSRKPLVEVMERLPPQFHLKWCRYHQAWNNVFRETLRSSIESIGTSTSPKSLASLISKILEWEALDDLTTLQKVLIQTQGIPDFEIQRRDTIQQAARTCAQKIQSMPPISLI